MRKTGRFERLLDTSFVGSLGTLLRTASSLAVLALVAACTSASAQTAYFSGAQITLATTGFESSSNQVAVDTSGNVFFTDAYHSKVQEIPTGCGSSTCVKTLGGGFSSPEGVAVAKNGTVFVADSGNGVVKEIPAGCSSSSCVQTLGSGFIIPVGVAVDGNSNVFVVDLYAAAVYEILASGGYNSVNILGGGFSGPQGVALDGSGNVFVADAFNDAVKEIPKGCTSFSCVKTLGGGFSDPQGVSVDGSGNVFVADTNNNAVKRIPTNCVTSTCVQSLGYGFLLPYGLAVDASGNVYTRDFNNWLVKIETGVVDFGTLAVGKTGPTIPLIFTFETGGTNGWGIQSLDFSPISPSTCTNGTIYFNAGDACVMNIAFMPQSTGVRTGAAHITNNSGTTIASANLRGTGAGATVSTKTTLMSSLNPSSYGQSVTITATVVAVSGSATPTGTVQFKVDGSSAGSATTLSGGGAKYVTSTLAAGTHSIAATYSPSTGSSFSSSSAPPLSQVVNKIPSAATPSFKPAAGTYGEAQLVTLASATTGATIYYTVDGSVPTASSKKYTNAIPITASQTVKAVAIASGFGYSNVASAAYTLVGSPTALTGLATTITGSGATLTATVNDQGAAAKVWFLWGSSATTLSSSTAKGNLSASASALGVSAALVNLQSKTTYYFQPVVSTLGGTSYGAVQSFKTN